MRTAETIGFRNQMARTTALVIIAAATRPMTFAAWWCHSSVHGHKLQRFSADYKRFATVNLHYDVSPAAFNPVRQKLVMNKESPQKNSVCCYFLSTTISNFQRISRAGTKTTTSAVQKAGQAVLNIRRHSCRFEAGGGVSLQLLRETATDSAQSGCIGLYTTSSSGHKPQFTAVLQLNCGERMTNYKKPNDSLFNINKHPIFS